MFKGHSVITDEEVGDYVKKLHEDVAQDYEEVQLELCDDLATDSTKSTSWPKDKNKLRRVR